MFSRRRLLAMLPALPLARAFAADERPPLPITGTTDAKYSTLDDLMTLIITKAKLPGGATLAVARDGRTLYHRGFGYADREGRADMRQDTLFRISSISKTFTAVAVLQLVEQGKLKLDDRALPLLNLRPAGAKPDARLSRITVRNLLEHRGGWNHSGKDKVDPTFASPAVVKELGVRPPAMQQAVINYVLRRPLDEDPGTKFVYCNFGYLLLGRLIEKVSNQTYPAYVQRHVLDPLDLKSVRQGRTLFADRAPNEARYYSHERALAVMGPMLGKPVPYPYGGFCLESMDSHSAWLASSADLARFASHFENPKTCRLLKPETVELMFARPEGEKAPAYYAKGWLVKPEGDGRNYWHDGSMEGTSAMLIRRADGVTFSLLFNTRQQVDNTDPAGALDRHLHQALALIFAKK